MARRAVSASTQPTGNIGLSGNQSAMAPSLEIVAATIDAAPLNRGLRGADWLASEGNIPVTFGNGDIALFDDEGDGDYEVHFLFVSRGKEAICHARKALQIMFEEQSAKLIFGLTPVNLKHARLFNRWIGGKSAGFRMTANGLCELFVMSKSMWKGN